MIPTLSTDFKKSKKCCNKSLNSVKLVAVTGCADDITAVATLPDQWKPKHSGPALANYLKGREQEHEKILLNLVDTAKTVNGHIDTRIRAIAQILLMHTEENEHDTISVILPKDRIKTEKDHDKALKKINQLHLKRIEDIAKFGTDAMVLERERSAQIKKILRDHFQCLISNGHMSPKDLLHDFDGRIYDINQQLLSNLRAYNELNVHLHSQAYESVVRARSTLKQVCLILWREQDDYSCNEKHDTKLSHGKPDGNTSLQDHDVNNIVNNVSQLLEFYKRLVAEMFIGLTGKLSTISKEMGVHVIMCNTNVQIPPFEELKRALDETIHKMSTLVHTDNSFFYENESFMIQITCNLKTLSMQLNDTYIIMHEAAHLWDNHMLRSSHAQQLIRTEIEDLIIINDSIELSDEVAVNVAIELLRGCPEIDKLEHQHEVITAMLNRIANTYQQHNEAEINKIENYMNLYPAMRNVLFSEYKCFLEKHPRSDLQASSTMTEQSTPKSVGRDIPNTPLASALLQTELQGISLSRWTAGFLETLESNMTSVSEDLKLQIRVWIDDRLKELNLRKVMKLFSHSVRIERVKFLRQMRLAELRYHEMRLNSHLKAIYDLVDKLPNEAALFLSLEAPQLYPIGEWIDRIQTNINELEVLHTPTDPEVKKLKMTSYALRISKYRKLFEESLDFAISCYKKQIEYKIQSARISNVQFVSQLKLFNEGGNYSSLEATKTSTALVRAADALEMCINKTMDAIHQRRSQLMSLADQQLAPIQKMIVEVLKNGSKFTQDKRKPTPAKK